MKTFNKILMSLGVAASVFGLSSCVDDLDLMPTNPSDITNVSDEMDRVFTDIYLNFSTFGAAGNSPVSGFDGGMASFQRALFIAEEIPTDEACWLWDPASYGTINYGQVVPTVDCVFGFYSRLMINITLCNQFIQSVENGTFNEGNTERAKEYVRQAKILRSGCYYYMLSFYDKIPYADENTPVGALPTQLSRTEVVNRVLATLDECIAAYPANQRPAYGFVGLDAAEAIAMKIALNAGEWTGTPMWDKTYTYAKHVIDRLGNGGYYGNGLARSYQALFGFNNDQYVLGGSSPVNEIIWTLAQNYPNLLSWSGATFMICGWLATNGVEATTLKPTMNKYTLPNGELDEDQYVQKCEKYYADKDDYDAAVKAYEGVDAWKKKSSEIINNVNYSFDPKAVGYIASSWYNASGAWKCMVARKTFTQKFEWNEVNMATSDDRRVALWQTSRHGFTADNTPTLTGDDWGKNGYIAPKFSNWAYNEDGTIDYINSPTPTEQVGGDYPVIRLAEVYLTAAEAILNGGGTADIAEAMKYVNYLRERAYGDAPGDATHHLTSLTMQQLRDERCRELYHENVRRTDLIRWNQWCTGYTWDWKGGVEKGTNLPEYTKRYPIPSRVMSSSNFEQTTGY